MNMIEASYNVLGFERNKVESEPFTPSILSLLETYGGFEGLFSQELRSESESAALKKMTEELRDLAKQLDIKFVFSNGIERFDVDNSTFSTIDSSNPTDVLIMHQELQEQATDEGKQLCCITRLKKPRSKAVVLGTSFVSSPVLIFDAEESLWAWPSSSMKGRTDNETWQSPRRNTGVAKSRRAARKGGKK